MLWHAGCNSNGKRSERLQKIKIKKLEEKNNEKH